MDSSTALILFLLAYGVVGGLALRRWQKRHPVPANGAEPMVWLRYWLPPLVMLEVYVLLGGAAVYVYMLLALAVPLQSADGFDVILGGALGLVLSVLVFVAIDALALVSARRRARTGRLSADQSSAGPS